MATVTLTPANTFWVVPDGITLLDMVEVRGGGGSGGATTANTTAGGGGGGGAYARNNNVAVIPRTNITVAVGQGGASVTGNTNGVVGNNSSWNNGAILAMRGANGLRTNASGAGGNTASSIGQVKFAGGAGAVGVNSTVIGGGGGAGGGNNNQGNAGSGVNGGVGQQGGGSGGAGGNGRNLDGSAGYVHGGGGGGSGGNNSGTRASGAGGNGSIIITYQEKTIAGITYGNTGAVLGACDVYLFCDNGNNTATFLGNATSNATTGAYSFTVSGEQAGYFVVAFKTGSPNVADITTRGLTAV